MVRSGFKVKRFRFRHWDLGNGEKSVCRLFPATERKSFVKLSA